MKNRRFWGQLLIVVTSVFLFSVSIFAVVYVNRSVTERRNRVLNMAFDQEISSIQNRLDDISDSLYDLRGLFVLGDMSPSQWKNYSQAILGENHQISYSYAFVEKVKKEDILEFEKALRNTGDPLYGNYTVFPKTEGDYSYPIKYLFTTDSDIKSLLGFDFQYSERTMTAIKAAMVTDQPTLSELTHLDLIIPNSKKIGYEVVLPTYRIAKKQSVPQSEEKDKELIGFVGAWINSENLKSDTVNTAGLRYSFYDGNDKVFTSGRLATTNPMTTLSREVTLFNRKFRMVLETGQMYSLGTFEENLFGMTLAAVIIINLLWLLSVYTILSSRSRALDLADLATTDLRKFKQAVDGVSDHVIIADPNGVISYANDSAQRITGYSISEMIGKKPSLWGGQMPKEFYQNFWKIIKEDKKPFWGEIKNRRKNGELYEAEVHVSPILNEKGDLLFFVGIEKDLSRRKSIERMKTEFISLASHQLRTPLSAVKWFSEMLLDGNAGNLTKMQKEFVLKVNKSNEREIQLVNSLLNVSRIESGKIVVMPRETNLKKLVEKLISEMKVDSNWGNKKLTFLVDKNVPNLRIDPDLINHVYSNLLANAINYTPNAGKISVKIRLKGGKVISEVKDGGIGIPKGEQDRIFEKFFRASNAMKKNTDGNGLGLYLIKAIIESSGGKIWFTSSEGKGTTFTFSLPVKGTNKLVKNDKNLFP